MSIDTYLSLIIGSILGIVVTIYLAMIQTKDNKDGRKKIKIYKSLLLIFIVLSIALTISVFYSNHQNKREEFISQTNDAEFALNTGDFLRAAEHYNQAALIAFNEDTYLEAVYGQGMCYLLHGIYSEDFDYFHKASSIYSEIIKQTQHSTSMYYIDAMADLSFIYLFEERIWDDPTWLNLVSRLEDVFSSKPISEITKISSGELSLRLKVTYALAAYYEYATRSKLDNINNPEYSSKALIYYDELNTLYKWTVDFEGDYVFPGFDTHNIALIADSMLTYAISSNDPVLYCSSAIELCRTELRRTSSSSIAISEVIKLKKLIGKGLYFLSVFDKENSNTYLYELYTLLAPMIKISDNDAQSSLMDLAYYLVRSNLCTEAEINRVLEICEYSLSLVTVSSDPTTRAKWLISASAICKYVTEEYDYSTQAKSVGSVYAEELASTLVDYLDSDQLAAAEDFVLFFLTD